LVTLGLALGIAGISSASADTWAQKHPRRAEVNGRLGNQNRRIHTERKEGELTAAQARAAENVEMTECSSSQ